MGLAIAMCLLLPLHAMAVTEGVVEEAPMVQTDAQLQDESYLPDASYYAGSPAGPAWEDEETWVENRFDGELYYDVTQSPRLTAGEAARAKVAGGLPFRHHAIHR